MHRVINLTSTGSDAAVVKSHKEAIKTECDKYSDSLHTSEVNDGTNEEDKPTLAVNADFNDATQANTFNNWLKEYIKNNGSDFSTARIRIRDCFHASGENLPCEMGDVWQL